MDSRKFFLLILIIALVDADCFDGVQSCINKYLAIVQAHATRADLICNDIEVYVKCVFNQGCSFDDNAKQLLADYTKGKMAPLHCNYSMEDLIKRYANGNSASMLSPMNLTLNTIMSSILLIKKFVF